MYLDYTLYIKNKWSVIFDVSFSINRSNNRKRNECHSNDSDVDSGSEVEYYSDDIDSDSDADFHYDSEDCDSSTDVATTARKEERKAAHVVWKNTSAEFSPRMVLPEYKEPETIFAENCTKTEVFFKLFPKSLFMWISECTNERLHIFSVKKKEINSTNRLSRNNGRYRFYASHVI